MNLLIKALASWTPTSGLDAVMDLALAAGRVLAVGAIPAGLFLSVCSTPTGLHRLPGLGDLAARLREPGRQEHEGMLATEMAAAVVA